MNLADQLGRLETGGLIRQATTVPDLEYLFRHALVQDAAYGSLLRADRRRLHAHAGTVLEHLYPDSPRELAPLLATHFLEAFAAIGAPYYAEKARAERATLEAG